MIFQACRPLSTPMGCWVSWPAQIISRSRWWKYRSTTHPCSSVPINESTWFLEDDSDHASRGLPAFEPYSFCWSFQCWMDLRLCPLQPKVRQGGFQCMDARISQLSPYQLGIYCNNEWFFQPQLRFGYYIRVGSPFIGRQAILIHYLIMIPLRTK